jgi:hypothetical protein
MMSDDDLSCGAEQALLALRKHAEDGVVAEPLEAVREEGVAWTTPMEALQEAHGSGYLERKGNRAELTTP